MSATGQQRQQSPFTYLSKGGELPQIQRAGGMERALYLRRANRPAYYQETKNLEHARLPKNAPVPGYTGFFREMSQDIGCSKAFGLPIELMQIPATPDINATSDSVLEEGYGPTGKHKLGATSLSAGRGYEDTDKMLEALRLQRITGDGKRAPFDFVPGDGLVQECHIHTDQVYHRFPQRAPRVRYLPNKTSDPTVILRRPKEKKLKGYAPCVPPDRTQPGFQKYSVFSLPTYDQVQARRNKITVI